MKGKAIKLLENKKKSSCFWGRKGYFKQGTKRTNHKGKRLDKLDEIKTKNFCFPKDALKSHKDKPQSKKIPTMNITKRRAHIQST